LRANHGLNEFDASTWSLPFGTSLRMSDVGYRNKSQAGLQISLNSLAEYIGGLTTAVTSLSPEYERIGVEVDGEYRQLNANVLQIENEYYAAVRPKAKAQSKSRPTVSLRRDGVEYVEIRTLDLNMADPVGVNHVQLRFIEALLVYCLFADSPPISAAEQTEIDARELIVAREGRKPGLTLPVSGTRMPLRGLGHELLENVAPFAALLDVDDAAYAQALDQQHGAFENPDTTPSARMLASMREREQGFLEFTLDVSKAHHEYFRALPLADAPARELHELARRSLEEARAMEADPQPPFQDYLRAYFAEV
jgi:glutamate--cysteine ligase